MSKGKKQVALRSRDVVEFVGASVALLDHLRATEPIRCFEFGDVAGYLGTGRALLTAIRDGGGVVLVIPPAGDAGPALAERGASRKGG